MGTQIRTPIGPTGPESWCRLVLPGRLGTEEGLTGPTKENQNDN